MSFETDKQTLDDLNLLGKYKNNSVYSLYVGTITRGGERKMEDMFLHPLTDAKSINERSAVFRYFRDHDFGFPFGKDEFDVVEQYIAGASGKRAFMNMLQIMRAKAMFSERLGLILTSWDVTWPVILSKRLRNAGKLC